MIAPLILTLLGNTMKIPASARALSNVPGKTAHSGSQGQTGCEWALIVPSCAYSFFSDLFYREGYSAKQIADILQKNEATVRSDMHRGRARLKELLK